MTYQKIETTIKIHEGRDAPIDVTGEIEVEATDIANDVEAINEQVHTVTCALQDAIEGVLTEQGVADDV